MLRIGRASGSFPGLIAPALWFVAVRLMLHPVFPKTHAFVGDWTVHAQSAFAFAFGYAIAKEDVWWAQLRRHRRLLAALAALSSAGYAGLLALSIGGVVPDGAARGVMAWTFGLAE